MSKEFDTDQMINDFDSNVLPKIQNDFNTYTEKLNNFFSIPDLPNIVKSHVLNRFQEAIKNFQWDEKEEACRTLWLSADYVPAVDKLIIIAQQYKKQKQHDKAEKIFNDLFRQVDIRNERSYKIGHELLNLGEHYLAKNNRDKAFELFHEVQCDAYEYECKGGIALLDRANSILEREKKKQQHVATGNRWNNLICTPE